MLCFSWNLGVLLPYLHYVSLCCTFISILHIADNNLTYFCYFFWNLLLKEQVRWTMRICENLFLQQTRAHKNVHPVSGGQDRGQTGVPRAVVVQWSLPCGRVKGIWTPFVRTDKTKFWTTNSDKSPFSAMPYQQILMKGIQADLYMG